MEIISNFNSIRVTNVMIFGRHLNSRVGRGIVVASATGLVVSAAMIKRTFYPKIRGKSTEWNDKIRRLCPHLASPYQLPFVLNNGHIETIFAALFRKNPHITYEREIVRMPDGGSVALDSQIRDHAPELGVDAPVLILLPGLTGGSGDTYVQHAVIHAKKAGIRAIVFNSRGTSDSPVTTAQFYSASFTGDMRCVVAHVASKYPDSRIFAAGWSLGANILTRYLGEEGENTPIQAAAVMCNPFDLTKSDENFNKGINRIYDWNLAKALKRIYSKHYPLFLSAAEKGVKPYQAERALEAKTIRDFDDAITRISFGWTSVDEYYAQSSSSLSIPHVKIPLLVVQAEDDPIAPSHAIPYQALDENPNCLLVLTPTGGHLGWCNSPGVLDAPWTDIALLEYFKACDMMLTEAHAERLQETEYAGVETLETIVVQE